MVADDEEDDIVELPVFEGPAVVEVVLDEVVVVDDLGRKVGRKDEADTL